ncbi:MAG: class I SAM-dependent methyltransferase [Nanoarchaeota archaeon]|nr:class I SAM-dependent methyltransferase [Nanoarchaeota archaeon]MBU1005767.1 class I SAM-dependent methyltransferase [Nanoarchaeota archaeon]MBU1946638.1 class I SAM-dependent methyltransferase [Nanoarchaeota archaeon]
MISKFLKYLSDSRNGNSLAAKLRRKRFAFFKSLILSVSRPLKILDVGGTQVFWDKMGFCDQKGVEITLFNIKEIKVTRSNFKHIIGDARNMKKFKDKEFDVVFSNSVIEHVGGFNEQLKMANEVKRVGKRYFLQTPNFYFPIEPHFLFPFFQFFPLWLKVMLVTNFELGWFKKADEKETAAKMVNSIRLLRKRELREMFPYANFYEEKCLSLTKSFVVYGGWDIH